MTQDKNREALAGSLSEKLRELAKAIQIWDGETPATLLLFEAADKLSDAARDHYAPKLTEKEAVAKIGRAIWKQETNHIQCSWDTVPNRYLHNAEATIVALKAAGMRFKEEA